MRLVHAEHDVLHAVAAGIHLDTLGYAGAFTVTLARVLPRISDGDRLGHPVGLVDRQCRRNFLRSGVVTLVTPEGPVELRDLSRIVVLVSAFLPPLPCLSRVFMGDWPQKNSPRGIFV